MSNQQDQSRIPHWVWRKLHVYWARFAVTAPINVYRLPGAERLDDYLESKYTQYAGGERYV